MALASKTPCWSGKRLGTSFDVLCLNTIYWAFLGIRTRCKRYSLRFWVPMSPWNTNRPKSSGQRSCLGCYWPRILRYSKTRQHSSCQCRPPVPLSSHRPTRQNSRSAQDVVEVTAGWSVSAFCTSISMFCTSNMNMECISRDLAEPLSWYPVYRISCRQNGSGAAHLPHATIETYIAWLPAVPHSFYAQDR